MGNDGRIMRITTHIFAGNGGKNGTYRVDIRALHRLSDVFIDMLRKSDPLAEISPPEKQPDGMSMFSVKKEFRHDNDGLRDRSQKKTSDEMDLIIEMIHLELKRIADESP